MENPAIIILIGLGKDLGLSIARSFGNKGYHIVIMGRNVEKIKEQVWELSHEKINYRIIPMDVTDEKSVNTAFEIVKSMNQPIGGLIYNVVARRNKIPSKLTADEAADDFKVNVGGAITCTNKILGFYKKQAYGTILYTGGGVALTPSLHSSSMSLDKAALRNYVLNLHNELKDSPIFIGIITITRPIENHTDHSPARIAQEYIRIFEQKDAPEYIL